MRPLGGWKAPRMCLVYFANAGPMPGSAVMSRMVHCPALKSVESGAGGGHGTVAGAAGALAPVAAARAGAWVSTRLEATSGSDTEGAPDTRERSRVIENIGAPE